MKSRQGKEGASKQRQESVAFSLSWPVLHTAVVSHRASADTLAGQRMEYMHMQSEQAQGNKARQFQVKTHPNQ